MTTLHGFLALALSSSLALAPLPALASNLVQDPSTMSDEDKMNMAKQLYGEGDAALNDGDAATALTKFEDAYNNYAPSLHIFNHNIGLAALELGDCVKAKTSFQRFLDLVPDHPARSQAQEKLLEIERSKCDEQQAAQPEPAAVVTPAPVSAEHDNQDAPELTSRRSEREDAIEEERDETDAKRASGKLIAGAALTAVGAAGLIGGGVSLGIASRRANDLASLASPGATGFPEGDYSDDDVANLDRNGLPAANTAAIALFVGGGVLAVVGATLIVLDVRDKKAGDKNARAKGPRLTSIGPTFMRGGGGAGATVRF